MGRKKENCEICHQTSDRIYMLPCFHVACMVCIFKMPRTAEDGAGYCSLCLDPFLVKNMDSLPRPVRCAACGNFAKGPRTLPCCGRHLCLSCIVVATDAHRHVVCPTYCSNAVYGVHALPRAHFCRVCFRLNNDPVPTCEHRVCAGCQGLRQKQSNCALCLALCNKDSSTVGPLRLLSRKTPRQIQALPQEQKQRNCETIWEVLMFLRKYAEDFRNAAAFTSIALICSLYTGYSVWLWLGVGGLWTARHKWMQPSLLTYFIEMAVLNAILMAGCFVQNTWLSLRLGFFLTLSLANVVCDESRPPKWFVPVHGFVYFANCCLGFHPIFLLHFFSIVFSGVVTKKLNELPQQRQFNQDLYILLCKLLGQEE